MGRVVDPGGLEGEGFCVCSIDDVSDDSTGSIGVESIIDTFFLPPGCVEYSFETIVSLYPESEGGLGEESTDSTGAACVERVRGGSGS